MQSTACTAPQAPSALPASSADACAPPPDSGLLALLVMAQFHGLPADEARLRHEYGGAAFDVTMLLHAAKSLCFAHKAVRQPQHRLHKATLRTEERREGKE